MNLIDKNSRLRRSWQTFPEVLQRGRETGAQTNADLSLLLLTVSAEFLEVYPDYEQFFRRDMIRLSCDESWSVKRIRTGSTEVQSCGRDKDFGRFVDYGPGSICLLFRLSSSDSGLYWCESATGDRSLQRLLSFTDRNLILDSPALPIAAGSDITLSCRSRSDLNPVLVKDGTVVHNEPQWSFTVSKEHEGEYSCRDERRQEESEKERLTVTELPTASSPLPPPPPSFSFGWVWWQVVRPLLVSSPYGVCTVLLVLVYRGQRRKGSPGLVSMETGQQQQQEEYDDVDAAVTTEHRF